MNLNVFLNYSDQKISGFLQEQQGGGGGGAEFELI